MKPQIVGIVFGLLIFLAIFSCSTVSPGNRGVGVTLGTVNTVVKTEGPTLHLPFVTRIHEVSVRQQTDELTAPCFSSDLQQVNTKIKVLYKIPENRLVEIFQQYSGNPFDTLVVPRVQESLKEVTAGYTAEGIVKNREEIKMKALENARKKVGDIVTLVDLVVENIDLSKELEQAIEAKMVQEQEASKAKFIKQQAQVDAETAVIKAKAEAEAISIRGRAIRENPSVIDLEIAKKWDGKTPLVVGGEGKGANILLPLKDK